MQKRRSKDLIEKEEMIFFFLQKRPVWSLVYWLSINIVPDSFMNVNYKYCVFYVKMYSLTL